MIKSFNIFICLFIFLLPGRAQEGCQISVNLQSYHNDTLWFGHTFGKRAVPGFFALRGADGTFDLRSEGPLPAGIYAIIYRANPKSPYQYVQVCVAEGQREFGVETSIYQPITNLKFSGSAENDIFYEYRKGFEALDSRLDSLTDAWRDTYDEATFRQRVAAEEDLLRYQEGFIDKNKGTLTAGLVSQTLYALPPRPSGKSLDWKLEAHERWLWQRQHFFDRMDIGTPDFMKYPQWIDRTDYFILHLPPPNVDTAKSVVDEVFKRLQPNPEALEYYHNYLVNSLGRMSKYRADEVFVHIVRNYVEAGKAPWTEPDQLENLKRDADRMEPLFLGKQAPDIPLFDRDKNAVTLHGIKAPLTILVFYLPDCSHCQREMPRLKSAYEKFKDRGLKIAAVCGKYREDVPKCWEFVDTQQLPVDWYALVDPLARSRMSFLYNLRSFPRIFFLDAGKKIVYKRNGEMTDVELDRVLERIMGSMDGHDGK